MRKMKQIPSTLMKVIMMNTEKSIQQELTDEQSYKIQEKIYKFLAKQIKLFTVGDSTSVTEDTAQELLTSIIYVLELALVDRNLTHKDLLTAEIEDFYNQGQIILTRKIDEGKPLLNLMKLSAPSYASEFYWATFRGITDFFAKYNPLFLAHQIPGEIDYPLCVPVLEQQLGIDYINDYLKRIVFENHILNMFNSNLVSALLTKCYSDFDTLPVNLLEPVIINAVGLTFLGEDPFGLSLPSSCASKIKTITGEMSSAELKEALINSAETLCSNLSIFEQSQIDYVVETALGIAPRIKEPECDISKIFVAL